MKITRKDPFTNIENVRDIDITEKQYHDWESGMLIQNAMPNISTVEREFIMSGITPASWKNHVDNEEPVSTTIQKKFFKHLEELFMARNIEDRIKDILNQPNKD